MIQVVFVMSKPYTLVVYDNIVALMWITMPFEGASEVACELLSTLVLQVTVHDAGHPDRFRSVWCMQCLPCFTLCSSPSAFGPIGYPLPAFSTCCTSFKFFLPWLEVR